MATHDLPLGIFWDTIRLDGAPIFHRATTHEIEWPYRLSNSLIIRLGKSFGLIVGRWGEKRYNENYDDMLKVLDGRELPEHEKWDLFSSTRQSTSRS